MKTSRKVRDGGADALVNPEKIRQHIEEICDKNTRLEMIIDDHIVTFQSLFVGGSQDQKNLLIDTLIPHEGDEIIKRSHSIKLVYMVDKIRYTFKSKYLDYIKDKSLLLIMYPTHIERLQRREYFRIEPSLDEPIEFSVELVIKIKGKMLDISAGGFAFLTEKKSYNIESGAEIKEVKLKLPGGEEINTPATVRYFGQYHDDKKFKCGVEFKALSVRDQEKIVGYTIQRQREILKKMKGE